LTISLDLVSSVGLPTGDSVGIARRRLAGAGGLRVAVVAGIRGDTPEGVRVAHLVAGALSAAHERLSGTVDVYPCVNPLAAHRGTRQWPFFDQDLNRRFPGRRTGHAPDRVAWELMQDLVGVDHLIEIRGAHPSFSEAPQAHVRVGDARALALARDANVNVIWSREPGPAAPSTLVFQFQGALVLEGGRGNRLTRGVGATLRDGVLNILSKLGVLPDDALPFHWAAINRPLEVGDDRVHRVRAVEGGLFLPDWATWEEIEAGARIGRVVDPLDGATRQEVLAPRAGRLMALREQPVIFPGSMVARVVEVEGG